MFRSETSAIEKSLSYRSIFQIREAEMFCPQCSNEILSERVRFCTRCSFPVGMVKELVATESAGSKVEEGKNEYSLRQQDISLGAGLMVIGLMKAIAIVTGFGGGNREHELLVLT